VLDLREDDLLADAEREVAAPVEALGRHAAEVADARQGDVAQAIEELPHALFAQRDGHADLLALAQLVVRDVLLGARDDRRLTGDELELLDGVVDDLRVLVRLAQAHVDRDLHDPRHLHDGGVVELLHHGRLDGAVVERAEARRLLALVLGRRTGRLGLLLLAAALFLLGRLDRLLGRSVGGLLFFLGRHGSVLLHSPGLGNLVPLFTPTRILLPPSSTSLVRVPRPSFSSHRRTFAIAIVPSLSMMPPCGFFCVGLEWRLIMLTFSTITRSPTTRRILPRLPLSLPLVTT